MAKPADLPALPLHQWITLGSLIAAPILLFALWSKGTIKPATLGQALGPLAAKPWWTLLFCALAIFFSGQFGLTLAATIIQQQTSAPREVWAATLKGQAGMMLGLSLAGLVASIALLILTTGSSKLPPLRDAARGLFAFAIAYPIVVAASVAAAMISRWITGTQAAPIAHETLAQITENRGNTWALVLTACAVLAAPIIEEVMYRAFLQTSLTKATGRAWAGIVLTSALFALAHASAAPPHALATLFVLSLALGLAMHKSGKVIVPITMHVAFNAVNVVLAMRG